MRRSITSSLLKVALPLFLPVRPVTTLPRCHKLRCFLAILISLACCFCSKRFSFCHSFGFWFRRSRFRYGSLGGRLVFLLLSESLLWLPAQRVSSTLLVRAFMKNCYDLTAEESERQTGHLGCQPALSCRPTIIRTIVALGTLCSYCYGNAPRSQQ